MQKKSFFAPVYTFASSIFPSFGAWRGGSDAKPPINAVVSYGGITVTQDVALTMSAVWACIFRYANTISTLPLHMMKTGPKNSATVATDHPLYQLLHDQPNTAMCASTFWQTMVISMMLWGQGYSRKLRMGKRIVALIPMRPEYTTLYFKNGNLRCSYAPPSTTDQFDVPIEDIFTVFDRTLDGYSGASRIEFARNSMGLAIAADRVSGAFYRNGLRVSGILTVAQWLKEDQREAYRASLQKFAGSGNGDSNDAQFQIMLAENATKFDPLNFKPVDVELLASRRFSIEEICRWFDTPPVLIGHAAEGQTMWGSGVEQIILGWQKLGLAPILKRIEQEISRQLIEPEERMTYYAEFNLDALLRGDSAGRTAMYSSMSQNGIYTRNEIRAKENLPPVEGGDIATVQSNLVPLKDLEELAKKAAEKPAPQPGGDPTDGKPEGADKAEEDVK